MNRNDVQKETSEGTIGNKVLARVSKRDGSMSSPSKEVKTLDDKYGEIASFQL